MDIRETIKKADYQRAYIMEGLTGILNLIRETRPDVVLGLGKGEKGESGLSGVELKDWNSQWVDSAREMITELWKTGKIMAQDIYAVSKRLSETYEKPTETH